MRPDRPGGEGVAEAVGMDLRQADLVGDPPQEDVEGMGMCERLAAPRGEEESARCRASVLLDVLAQRLDRSPTDADPALLPALAVKDTAAAPLPIEVVEAHRDALRCPDAGIEQEEEEG